MTPSEALQALARAAVEYEAKLIAASRGHYDGGAFDNAEVVLHRAARAYARTQAQPHG